MADAKNAKTGNKTGSLGQSEVFHYVGLTARAGLGARIYVPKSGESQVRIREEGGTATTYPVSSVGYQISLTLHDRTLFKEIEKRRPKTCNAIRRIEVLVRATGIGGADALEEALTGLEHGRRIMGPLLAALVEKTTNLDMGTIRDYDKALADAELHIDDNDDEYEYEEDEEGFFGISVEAENEEERPQLIHYVSTLLRDYRVNSQMQISTTARRLLGIARILKVVGLPERQLQGELGKVVERIRQFADELREWRLGRAAERAYSARVIEAHARATVQLLDAELQKIASQVHFPAVLEDWPTLSVEMSQKIELLYQYLDGWTSYDLEWCRSHTLGTAAEAAFLRRLAGLLPPPTEKMMELTGKKAWEPYFRWAEAYKKLLAWSVESAIERGQSEVSQDLPNPAGDGT